MTSTAGLPTQSGRRIARAAVVTHGKAGQIGSGLARLQAVAADHGVELLVSPDDGLLGVAQLGAHLLELAAEEHDLGLDRLVLSDRSLEVRCQRSGELLSGVELFLESDQPALRV